MGFIVPLDRFCIKTVQIDSVLRNLIFSTTEHDSGVLDLCVIINKEDSISFRDR